MTATGTFSSADGFREEWPMAALAQLGDRRRDRFGPRFPSPYPVAVAMVQFSTAGPVDRISVRGVVLNRPRGVGWQLQLIWRMRWRNVGTARPEIGTSRVRSSGAAAGS